MNSRDADNARFEELMAHEFPEGLIPADRSRRLPDPPSAEPAAEPDAPPPPSRPMTYPPTTGFAAGRRPMSPTSPSFPHLGHRRDGGPRRASAAQCWWWFRCCWCCCQPPECACRPSCRRWVAWASWSAWRCCCIGCANVHRWTATEPFCSREPVERVGTRRDPTGRTCRDLSPSVSTASSNRSCYRRRFSSSRYHCSTRASEMVPLAEVRACASASTAVHPTWVTMACTATCASA